MTEVALIEVLTFLAGLAIILMIISVAVYVYFSIVVMNLARKTNTKYPWLAWIPIANFFLYSKMAGMHWWPIFLLVGVFIPYLGIPAILAFIVFNYIWFWKIISKVGKPGWWVLLTIIPFAGWLIFLILLGVAAWSQEDKTNFIAENQIRSAPRKPQPQRVSSARLDRIKKLKGSLK